MEINLEKYKNYTVSQLKKEIAENDSDQSFLGNLSEIYLLIWEKEKILNNAIKLVRVLRKEKKFDVAYNYHKKFKDLYPNNQRLRGEQLWCDFSSKVCNAENNNYAIDAENILKVCSQDNVSTKMIFEIVTLYTVSRLVKDEKFNDAYQKLIKLNPNKLDNKVRGRYPSNKWKFYQLKAQTLIGLNCVRDYLNWAYSILNFSKEKKVEFINEIYRRISHQYEKSNETKLANILYNIDNEINIKRVAESVINKKDHILISELSDYLFCPASFAIKKSFKIIDFETINYENKSWVGKKEGFLDKYIQYQENFSFDKCFENFSKISIEALGENAFQSIKMEFEKLFRSKIRTNNTIDNNLNSFRSDNRELVGAQDFILETANGEKIL